MTDDLRRRLEALADRGEPRGAEAVLADARRHAAMPFHAHRPLFVAAALVAAVLALLGTLAVVARDDDGRQLAGAAATSTTSAPVAADATTTAAATSTRVAPRPLTRSQRASRLLRYSSCDSLVRTTRRKALELAGPYGLPGTPRFGLTQTSGSASGSTAARVAPPYDGALVEEFAASEGGGSSGDSFSRTNVQEPGIDEPDTVETDGRRIFTLRDGRLWYSTVEAGRARIEGSIEIRGASQMLLVGDRAVVFGYRVTSSASKTGSSTFSTVISVVDVRTPDMGVAASLVFDGSYLSARAVDGVVRAVVRSSPTRLDWQYPQDKSETARAQAAAHNRRVVATAPDDTWLPALVIKDGIGRVRTTRSLVDCGSRVGAAYRPQRFAGFGMLTVLTLDPADPDAVTSTSIQADGDRVYASRDRLYVATNGWGRVEENGAVVPDPHTLVHAFDIADRSQARYTVSGRVRGTTIGQFAFSEHDGFLRVASTTFASASAPTATSESWVTVLQDTGAALDQIGQVGGLGKSERIVGVRFLGPVGYVVTFRQTDPLYVVDLADPRKPRVVGELKIPGFSAYLHPIGPGLLLGIGQDADDQGRVRGLQVSVFDVSDPARPVRLHQHVLSPGSGSSAEVDHHAFLWWAPTGLAVVPFWEWAYDGNRPFIGAVGLSAGREVLREVGRVEHPGGDHTGERSSIERSLVVGSTVFTVSHAGILAADLHTLASGAWSPFPAS